MVPDKMGVYVTHAYHSQVLPMSKYKCVRDGVVVNGVPYKWGKTYTFSENPDPRYFRPVYKDKQTVKKKGGKVNGS